jgi:histidine decarboxylase
LGTGRLTAPPGGSDLLERTIAFDRAEGECANLTQTNLIQVSSFCGLQGLLLGCDLLRQEERPHPLMDAPHLLDLEPLCQATRALLGTVREKRFPLLPGQHLLCAYKAGYAYGPCTLYGAMAIALPYDRGANADLFLEDHGTLAAESPAAYALQERQVLARLVDACQEIGQNLGVRYARIFLCLRACNVEVGEIGCALTAAPYLRLARRAVPAVGPELLARMSLAQWERAVDADFPQNMPSAAAL